MASERTFSFDQNDDTSYQPYRRAAGYQVASGSSYLPDPSRDQSSSPLSSAPSPPPQYHPQQQHPDQPRVSAYRSQRQDEASARSNSSFPDRRPLPPPPQGQVMLDGQPHSIPLPPMPTRSRSPQNQPMYMQNPASSENPFQQSSGRSSPPDTDDLSYPPSRGGPRQYASTSSQLASAAAAATPRLAPSDYGDERSVSRERQPSPYRDNAGGYSNAPNSHYRHSAGDPRQGLGTIDPMDIEDDDDDPFATTSGRNKAGVGAAGGAAAGAGGFIKGLGSRDASGSYGQVPGGSGEKSSDWLRRQTTGNKRLKWMVGGLIVLVIVLAIIGGAVGAVLTNKKNAPDGVQIPSSGELNKDSPQIQALMNNPRLHRVFPGMDYSPLNAQYPACLTNPPLQNNITADVAVLSQLSPIIRLYGTDCQQTEMVIRAIKALGLEKSMKIWGGIYLDGNSTTNARQTSQMYNVLDKYGGDLFEGIIVGNEVLFSEYMTPTELISKMDDVRANLQKRGLSSLKVATSDLGSKWDAQLTEATDVVMSNVHPFFGGVAAPQAASWTYTYWQNNDVVLTAGTNKGNVIAETGWPSEGGNYCASTTGGEFTCTSPTEGAVAGISQMNLFLKEWVCPQLAKKTNYFWFEAFDEPWKVQFDTKTQHWESKWGLMDVNRVLKAGVVIPDCGGQTADLR